MQEAASALEEWVHTWGLTISAHKSALMCFTLKPLQTQPSVTLSGGTVPYATSHKLLGLHFDGPRLTWASHIAHLRISCTKRLDVMKRLAGVSWGASRELLLTYYTSTIRAKLLYGCSIYGSAALTTLAKLDPIQNAALRISMGAMRSSPVVSLHAESGVPPLSVCRREGVCHSYHRLMSLPPSHPLTTL